MRVVIADDSAMPRDILRRVLRNGGFEVVEAVTNGDEAVEACRKHKPDLAVLDVSMSNGIQGTEAARIIVAEKLAGKVVMASSATMNVVVEQIAAIGAGFIPKPYNREEFLPRLLRFLEAK